MNNDVKNILDMASGMPKDDWQSYARCKRLLCDLPLSPDEYGNAIARLTEILRV